MPKQYTCPDLYDECKTISLSKLKEWGYLVPGQLKTGAIHWSRNEERYASIGIAVNMFAEKPYLELNYTCNGKPVKYKVYLVSVRSNIGKGIVWYFVCPHTNKRCRKLYMIDTYFLHRTAFRGAMYEKQTYSKKNRDMFRLYEQVFGSEKAYEELYRKNLKKQYRGKPTKRYAQLLKIIEQSERISQRDRERMFVI